MIEYKVQKLYRGCISLRSYDVDKWIEANDSVKVIYEGQQGHMILTPEELASPTSIGSIIESQFEGKEDYHLVDFKWNPVMNDIEKVYINLLGEEWFKRIGHIFERPYMKRLSLFLNKRRKEVKVYPKSDNTFKAFKLTPYSQVKVVIIGQDCYHNGVADGLAFSSQAMGIPKSLQIIFKEINNCIPYFNENRLADLTDWAKQGIFLFNTILTVEEGKPMSHEGKGWEQFSTEVIIQLNKHPNPLVFVLWGARAKKFKGLIDSKYHLVLESPHPASELYNEGTGFLGNGHFTKINEHLMKHFNLKIKW